MLKIILESIWFLLPAYLSNVMPVFVKRLHFFGVPVDFGAKIMGRPIFGKSKTYGGFVLGISGAIAISYIQGGLFALLPFLKSISIINYNAVNLTFHGFLMGFGALFGDLVKSFFKRRLNIESGKSWVPFDQADYIIGTLIFAGAVYDLALSAMVWMVIISIALHFIVVYLGYYLGIRKNKI